eukprot:TRINITY_DN2128_c0_g1_i1.p1 TRINITY_DN2128_c0_g1~~TRINITY_DN2128_c0_g1_i1.p1  ORF type:complete len:134 (+),score=58.12 TRINITY_DN2128_c0_g1_i1:28-402(+)
MATSSMNVMDVTESFSPRKKATRPPTTPSKKLAIQSRLENSPRKVTTPEQLQERLDRACQRKQEAVSTRLQFAHKDVTKAQQLSEQARNSPKKAANKENATDKELHDELIALSNKHERAFDESE